MSTTGQGKGWDVVDSQDRARFEQLVLPHLDAAFNLSRWLLRSRNDAEDVAQEALLRAFRFFRGFNGGDARAWLLQIVRNTCYTWLEKNRQVELMTEFDEDLAPTVFRDAGIFGYRGRQSRAPGPSAGNPAGALPGSDHLARAGSCSYKEIASITSVPIGTVMSALARARLRLQRALTQPAQQEAPHEL